MRLDPAVLNQQTLRGPAKFSGVGLHGGRPVRMTLLPAPAGTGVRFRRVDLEGRPEIEALVDHVGDTQRSTTLAKGNTTVHTVEHVLAALAGCGVDNAVVELDANEPPIADGSALAFSRAIDEAGIAPQSEPREVYSLGAPLELSHGETHFALFPSDRLKITCTSADQAGRYTQYFSVEISPDTWRAELARARTFCFFEEIEHLYKNGLIRGGSLESAVVIRDDAVLTTEPLRYPNEFVRHKILDLLGDLSLLGRPLHAHIVAMRPSHDANCELVRRIQAQMRRPREAAQTFAPPPHARPAAGAEALVRDGAGLDVVQVMKILPHRPPILMVDRVTHIDGNRITATKSVSINEPYFAGHFPGHPILPGVLQLEAIAQVAGILMLKQAENFGKLAYFMAADEVKWRKPVHPGDTLTVEVELMRVRGKVGKARGVCSVNGDPVSEAVVTFMLFLPGEP